jgi:hypothetical protein
MSRFFPDGGDLYDCFSTTGDGEGAFVLLAEGDLAIDAKGLVQTERLVPDLIDTMQDKDLLVGIIVTGNLVAPKATLLEPDIDWSPRIKVFGNLVARSLCLGGSLVEIGGDLIVESTIFGHYNHGGLRVAGKTTADVILASDYTMEFSGEVARRFALGDPNCMNIPVDFDGRLELAVRPELLDSNDSVKEADIINQLKAGKSILKAKSRIGKKSKPKVSKAAAEKLAAIAARAAAGETITTIDLTDSDLKLVPEEIRAYPELRVLRLSKNNVEKLPDWIGEFAALEVLAAESCGLARLPESVAHHATLRALDLGYNDIDDLQEDAFPALEELVIGRGWDDDHVEFIANLDLARFPKLRKLSQDFSGLPKLTFNPEAELWEAPWLEYFDLGAVFDEVVPDGLSRLSGLRGLSCAMTADAFPSALAVLAKFPQLKVLTLDYGADLTADDVEALRAALPGVYLRVSSDDPFDLGKHDREALCKQLSKLKYEQQFADAAGVAERLFQTIDFDRPDLTAELFETAMRDRVQTLAALALAETDPAARRSRFTQSVAWADRVLARLPAIPEIAWWTDRYDVGLLRFDCLLAKADGLIEQGASGEARGMLDSVAMEVERHLADHSLWLMQSRARIEQRRVRLAR